MKAVVFEKYGAPDVLQVKDVDTPAPKDDEVRIQVHATSVTAAEGMMRRGDTFMSRVILGLGRPKKKTGSSGSSWRGTSNQRAGASHASSRATRCMGSRDSGWAGMPSLPA